MTPSNRATAHWRALLVLVISAVAIAILYLTNRLERRQPAG